MDHLPLCSNATLERCWCQLHPNCSDNLVARLHKRLKEEIWQVDVLLFISAIFAGVIVGIGAYGHRHRYHALARHLYLGATTLVLPIISVLLSADSSTRTYFNITLERHIFPQETLTAQCSTNDHHLYMVILCACLVPLSAINTSSIVAGDYREARDIAPPFELLVWGIWIFYLVVTNNVFDEWLPNNFFFYFQYTPFAIIYTKMAYKYYAFERAMRSLALGHNPRLIVGYMRQLREAPPADQDHHVPPPLIVMGEEGLRQVVDAEHRRGHLVFNSDRAGNGCLVTIDRVWQSDNMLLVSMPQLKGICLLFALFKLLRC